jgi:hypothetical protein
MSYYAEQPTNQGIYNRSPFPEFLALPKPRTTMKTATATVGFLLAFASISAHAQLRSRPVPNRGVESFTFQSPSMGVRFSLNVGLPQGYKAGDGKKYPALIVTDGDFVFGNVYESASTLGRDRQRDVTSGRSACQPAVPGTQDDDRVPPRDGTHGRDGNFGGARAALALREVGFTSFRPKNVRVPAQEWNERVRPGTCELLQFEYHLR